MSAGGGRLEFWYEFSSTYSYIAAMRIEALAEAAGVAIDWKPFLLGPIFQSQGWNTSPFNLYPAKGRYMVREMERLAEQHGVPFRMPAGVPAEQPAGGAAGVGGCRGGLDRCVHEGRLSGRVPGWVGHLQQGGAGGYPARPAA